MSGIDLLSRIRTSLADLAELYAVLEEGVLDVVHEARAGLGASGASSATGLAASRVSETLHFAMPPDIGPETLTVSIDEAGSFVLAFEDEVEWMAMQVFLNLDASVPRRLFIEARYGGQTREDLPFIPVEYFFRLYNAVGDRFEDTDVTRAKVTIGDDHFHVHKFEPTPEAADLTGRNCLIVFFPRPTPAIVIDKLRIHSI